MASVPDIIDDLGGAAAIAAQIGVPHTTVHSWKRVGYVPAWRIPALVSLAGRLNKPITAESFPSERPTRLSADPAPAEQAAA